MTKKDEIKGHVTLNIIYFILDTKTSMQRKIYERRIYKQIKNKETKTYEYN